jgi:hypothetical protein
MSTGPPPASKPPACPRCSEPLAPLSANDLRNLALANILPWGCHKCFAMSDGASIVPIANVQAQERAHFLGMIQTIGTVNSPVTLQEVCDGLRTALATGSAVRYAWANVAPEALRALWEAMERIGGATPTRREELMHKPAVSEEYILAVLQAVNEVVRWCEEGRLSANPGVRRRPRRTRRPR